jgi:AraC-like DNA-binding protein
MRAVLPVVAALRELGADAAVLDRCGLAPSLLDHPDARVAHDVMMAVWHQARDVIGDPVGLQLARATPLQALGLHGYVALSSRSIAAAFHAVSRLQRLLHDTTVLSVEEDETALRITHGFPGGAPLPPPVAEYLTAVWLRVAREICPGTWRITSVAFAHAPPADCAQHRAVYGPAITFHAARTTLSIPRDVAHTPSTRADAGLYRVLTEYADVLLTTTSPVNGVADGVRALVHESLSRGQPPSLPAIAREMCQSARSLHRHLHREGSTFSEIVERARHELACRMLSTARPSVNEVAFATGFSELSAFYRAFRRWTGLTPAGYRRQALARSAGA